MIVGYVRLSAGCEVNRLIELQTNDLSRVVGRMKSRSTLGLNRHFGRTGPIWQKGFHDHALHKEENLKTVTRYIIANPLRAGW